MAPAADPAAGEPSPAQTTGPIKTYSDKPAAPQVTEPQGWKESGLDHVDPDASNEARKTEPTPAAGAALKLQPIVPPSLSQTT
jgi:hypothetical protein